MTKDEALRMALEALESIYDGFKTSLRAQYTAITAIKEALAQLEQEPLSYLAERHFCPRCGKRRGGDVNYIHTCTPPRGLEMT